MKDAKNGCLTCENTFNMVKIINKYLSRHFRPICLCERRDFNSYNSWSHQIRCGTTPTFSVEEYLTTELTLLVFFQYVVNCGNSQLKSIWMSVCIVQKYKLYTKCQLRKTGFYALLTRGRFVYKLIIHSSQIWILTYIQKVFALETCVSILIINQLILICFWLLKTALSITLNTELPCIKVQVLRALSCLSVQ